MRVVATKKFQEEGVRPIELDIIPGEGLSFEVTEERAKDLSAKGYVTIFVEEVVIEEKIVAKETKVISEEETKKEIKKGKRNATK